MLNRVANRTKALAQRLLEQARARPLRTVLITTLLLAVVAILACVLLLESRLALQDIPGWNGRELIANRTAPLSASHRQRHGHAPILSIQPQHRAALRYSRDLADSAVFNRSGSEAYQAWARRVGLAPLVVTTRPRRIGAACSRLRLRRAHESAYYTLHTVVQPQQEWGWPQLSPLLRSQFNASAGSGDPSALQGRPSQRREFEFAPLDAIVIDLNPDNNIFHQLDTPATACAVALAAAHPNATLLARTPDGRLSIAQAWMRDVLDLISPVPFYATYVKPREKAAATAPGAQSGAAAAQRPGSAAWRFRSLSYAKFKGPHLWRSFAFDPFQLAVPALQAVGLAARRRLVSPPPPPAPAPAVAQAAAAAAAAVEPAPPLSAEASRPRGAVLLLLRSSRTLVDDAVGTSEAIAAELWRAGLPVEVGSFSYVPTSEQVRSAAAASVLISVHGADLTNMLWMRPGTAAIEVTLRYGWCCDPVPQQHWGNEAPPCEACDSMYGCCRARDYRLQAGACKAYHKADYANLAHAMGLRYAYFDPSYMTPPRGANPIDRELVHVDSKALATLAVALYEDVMDASKDRQ